MRRIIATSLLSLILLTLGCAAAIHRSCHATLWPNKNNFVKDRQAIPFPLYIQMISQANKSIDRPVPVVKQLISSGITRTNDPRLIATRKAFKNADNVALLAIAYRLSNKSLYLQQVKKILLTWARVNHANGNPINTSRISGLFWAYDLVHCQLRQTDRQRIKRWLGSNEQRLRHWYFGKMTNNNNYRTHQLKTLLLIDRILGNKQKQQTDKQQAIKHSKINISLGSGKTLDYKQRDALYYQNFDLQPWIEIVLLSHCCQQRVTKAFDFLSQRILSNHLGGEFSHSVVPFDHIRAQSGFAYAQKNGRFNIEKAIPTMIAFKTLTQKPLVAKLDDDILDSRKTPWIIFLLLRQLLWNKT